MSEPENDFGLTPVAAHAILKRSQEMVGGRRIRIFAVCVPEEIRVDAWSAKDILRDAKVKMVLKKSVKWRM